MAARAAGGRRRSEPEARDDLPAALAELQEQRQRSDFLTRSTQAIQRVIDAQGTTRRDRAEAYALQGRNIKARWVQSFEGKPTADARLVALRSPGLTEALQGYASAFQQDLNHFSSGVNAMALLRIRLDLAQAHPEVWLDQFDSEDEARRELDSVRGAISAVVGRRGAVAAGQRERAAETGESRIPKSSS